MKMDYSTKQAYERLRKTLDVPEDADLWYVLSVANTRINRLQDTLDGKYDPEEARKRLGI
jgi:hypothetical protein